MTSWLVRDTKRCVPFIALISTLLLAATPALAAGGGGGGSVPSCAEDIWTCNDWSACSTSGSQSRTCERTFDCPTVDTPMPIDTQSCTPPPIPQPLPPPLPTAAPAVTSAPATAASTSVTAAPASTAATFSAESSAATAQPSCTMSTWVCDSWSGSCGADGLQHRACHVAKECPASPTPSPATARACDHLQCAGKSTLHDRISCRLNLTPAGVAQEFKLQYLPEECRAMTDATEREECITRYKAFTPCWSIPAGEERFACARNILALKPTVAQSLAACLDNGADACKRSVREKVLYMVKFRMYDLNQRAEELANRGADLGAVAALETTIETEKQKFDLATSTGALEQSISSVKTAWRQFVEQVKNQVH